MRFSDMFLPLHIRSLRHLPPELSARRGVLEEQSNTGRAGVEMDPGLNATLQGIKYLTGSARILLR